MAEYQDMQPDQSLNGLDTTGPNSGDQTEGKGTVKREEPQIAPERENLVKEWQTKVKADKKHWKSTFEQMRKDQDFAYGRQWSESRWDDDRYTVNITLRHIQQRVASLYARNPTVVVRRKEKLLNTVWDGTMSGVMMAMTQMQNMAVAGQSGQPVDPMQAMQPMQVLQEAQQSVEAKAQMDKFAKTLELLYDYNIEEQAHPFKSMLKLTVRRAATTGVGYVKLGFQRIMEMRPEVEEGIADVTRQLAELERVANAAADNKLGDDHAGELEQLRLQMQQLQATPEAVVREGLIFDYPESTSIIPDKQIRQLKNFLGADYVTQEYQLSPEEIEKVYGVDIGESYKAYRPGTTNDPSVSPVADIYEPDTAKWSFDLDETDRDKRREHICLVWEIYDRNTGLVYVVCDGYKDFLREPAAPDVWTENFYPWYPLVLNECDHPTKVFPPSDVQLIRDQQKEYNRLREGLREHRIANRPATAVAGGMLSEQDQEKMINRPSNALIELDGLQPGQSVEQLIQPMRGPGLDPNLYEVNGIFEDVLRAVGVQEANLGAAGGATATETSIAESARQSSLASNVDDLDDMLTRLARSAGQILLAEVSEETVKETVGPGAMWPQLTREQLAKELFLEIEAGSTGRPNQAQEVQNFERLAPLMMQIPGISPEMLAKEAIRRLDDRLKLEDLYDANQISIQAMNQVAGSGLPPGQAGQGNPEAQGAEGAQNAEQPGSPAGASSAGTQPTPPVQ